jgi:uroporphyrinogen-III synthase
MSRAAILLKSPSRDPATDAYVQQFSSSGYTPYVIEALASVFVNEQRLEDILRVGPSAFLGVAITSSRAADAWIQALKKIDAPG